MLRSALKNGSGSTEMNGVVLTLTLDDVPGAWGHCRVGDDGMLVLGIASLVDFIKCDGAAGPCQ